MKKTQETTDAPQNPYPRGYRPFRAIPVRDAFPRHAWACWPIFDGYLALVPNRLPDEAPVRAEHDIADCFARTRRFCDYHRRRDILRILACATEEAAENGDVRLAEKLGKIASGKIALPAEIRLRHRVKRTTRIYRHDNTTPDRSETSTSPASRFVQIGDIIRGGYAYALQHAEEVTQRKLLEGRDRQGAEHDEEA